MKRSTRFAELLDDTASKDDIKALVKQLKEFVADFRKKTDALMAQNKDELAKLVEDALPNMQETSKRFEGLTNETKTLAQSEIRTITRLLGDEVKRLEGMIPNPTDLAPLEQKVAAAVAELEGKIPNLPEELAPEGIRDKLETLEGEARLKIDAIHELREALDKMNKQTAKLISGGGGQLDVSHWPRHEQFTMDGVATTVTLVQGVGAAGNAIFGVRYQGQVQALGTDYTVDGNKITFVSFIPEADTIISVTYMP